SLTRTRIATAAARRTATAPRATAALTEPAVHTPTGRAHRTPTSTAAAPRITTMAVRATPTPMAAPLQARPAMVQLTRTPMVQQPPTIRPHRTIRIIRLPLWATTEQGATTAALVRLPEPPSWAPRSAWLPVQP